MPAVETSPLHPLAVLRALHAVHFFALPGAPLAAGLHRARVGEVEVEERWEERRLRERRLRLRDAAPPFLELRFEDHSQVWMRHAECGYEARLLLVSDSRSD